MNWHYGYGKCLRNVCGLPESEPLWITGRGFVVCDLPCSEEKLRAIPLTNREILDKQIARKLA